MLALEMSDAFLGRAKEITVRAERNGLLLLLAGPDVIRFVPPLLIADEHIRQAETLLRRSVDEWAKTVK
jgi:acetylornithine/succinyldiaminopimelate/putrescine aminotransferase